jgi:hypothetical protein
LGNRISGSYFSWKVNYSTIDDSNNLILAGQYRILDSDQPDISTPGAHQTQNLFYGWFYCLIQWDKDYGVPITVAILPSFISVNDYYDRITGLE